MILNSIKIIYYRIKERIKRFDSKMIYILIYVYRFMKYVLIIFNTIFGNVILIFILPFAFILSVFIRNKYNYIFFIGLEHVITKTKNRAFKFGDYGFNSIYYTFESSNVLPKRKDKNAIKVPSIISFDIIKYLYLIIKYKPKYIEIYCEGYCYRQLYYCLISRLFNILNIVILRGELYYFKNFMNMTKKLNIIILLYLCEYILYRETYMKNILKYLRINSNKYKFDPNKISVLNRPIPIKNDKCVLFLNGFKYWRRVELFIKSYLYVRNEFKDVKYYCVGARNEYEMNYAKNVINKLKLAYSETNNIYIDYWTDNPNQYYDICSIFVLPADLVYLNFSLLEAMERGLVPIVADVEDSDKIINHGINGFLCKQDEKEIAKYIKILLTDNIKLREMSNEARKTIINKYNDAKRIDLIIDMINNKYKQQI